MGGKATMDPRREYELMLTRRQLFGKAATGIGVAALASLLGESPAQAALRGALAQPHFAPKAKRVIYLFQSGAPSHLDLFDYKPQLAKRGGQLPPAELLKDYRAAFINPNSALLGPKYKFVKHGKSGTELCELLPQLG